MAILIKDNVPSLVELSVQDFIKLGIHGVYTTMKTVMSPEYIFNFSLHMNNLHKYCTNYLKVQENDTNREHISKILKYLTIEDIYKNSSKNIKTGFEYLNNLQNDLKNKHFSDNSNYMVMITLTWDMNSTVDTLEKYYSILCYIKCLPKHQDHVQIDMMCGERKTPNIKYADVFQVRDKFLKLKNENSHEVVLFNESNQITEGLSCNFFCFLNNTLYTAKDELVLKGTIREQIINLCERENIKLKKDFIDIKDIHKFEFSFICSTTRNILPIRKIILFTENRKEPYEMNVNHPILLKLQDKLNQDIENKKEKYETYI